jgi:hypothetical protein
VKLAFTIGAYRLYDFIKLGLLQLQKLSPESPILISDDVSPESKAIQKLAEDSGVEYMGSSKRRGHFASDFQSLVNAMVFAEAMGCDVSVKVSQRFIFKEPASIDALQRPFESGTCAVITPGQPTRALVRSALGFTKFAILTDVVAIRVGALSAEELLKLYRDRISRETVPWASYVECAIHEMQTTRFQERTCIAHELTDHQDPRRPIYLRRYQNREAEYIGLAASLGFGGRFPTGEWGQIEGGRYLSRPLVV